MSRLSFIKSKPFVLGSLYTASFLTGIYIGTTKFADDVTDKIFHRLEGEYLIPYYGILTVTVVPKDRNSERKERSERK